MRRLLVTGLHGFVGRTVARMLASEPALSGWALVPVAPDFQILDGASTEDLVATTTPDAVLHLAAQSSVEESFRDPEQSLKVNVIGTLRLLEALRKSRFAGPMLFASSGEVYGVVPEAELPITESRLPAPRNPYAVSKLAAEALCEQWASTEGIRIVIARPFNHIGPGQGEQFAIPAFARQIADIRRGRRVPVVEVGNVDVTRDFTDVRDVVLAYFALLAQGASGVRYNVCSGQERTVRSMLETLIELAGVEVDIRCDAARVRPSEQRRAVGDFTRLCAATGWRPSIPVRKSLADVLAAAEEEV